MNRPPSVLDIQTQEFADVELNSSVKIPSELAVL